MTSLRAVGSFTAYAALYIAAFGIPLVAISDPYCRFVGSDTQDYTADLTEPAHTGAPIAFLGGPLLAFIAIVVLVQARRGNAADSPSRLSWACAIAVFPVALAAFLYYLAKGLGACGPALL